MGSFVCNTWIFEQPSKSSEIIFEHLTTMGVVVDSNLIFSSVAQNRRMTFGIQPPPSLLFSILHRFAQVKLITSKNVYNSFAFSIKQNFHSALICHPSLPSSTKVSMGVPPFSDRIYDIQPTCRKQLLKTFQLEIAVKNQKLIVFLDLSTLKSS